MPTPQQDQPASENEVARTYPAAPLVGMAAAVFDEAGRVLLVQRGRPPAAGTWGLPGGLLRLGERLVDGVRREVREECSVEIQVGDVVGVFEPMVRDEEGRIKYHYVVVDYWARWLAGVPQAGDDAAAAAWVALDQLAGLPMQEETRRVIHKAHRAWLHGMSASGEEPDPQSDEKA